MNHISKSDVIIADALCAFVVSLYEFLFPITYPKLSANLFFFFYNKRSLFSGNNYLWWLFILRQEFIELWYSTIDLQKENFGVSCHPGHSFVLFVLIVFTSSEKNYQKKKWDEAIKNIGVHTRTFVIGQG